MLPARLLSWFPKAAIGSAFLESLTAHGRSRQEKRLLRLVRLQTAFTVSCPFCIDMNAFEYEKHGVSVSEFEGLQYGFPEGYPPTLSRRDRKSTRLNSSHGYISYAVFCLKKKTI